MTAPFLGAPIMTQVLAVSANTGATATPEFLFLKFRQISNKTARGEQTEGGRVTGGPCVPFPLCKDSNNCSQKTNSPF